LGSRLELAPEGELLAQALGLTQCLLGGSPVVPEAGLATLRVEIG
jgi:hypothetical protein